MPLTCTFGSLSINHQDTIAVTGNKFVAIASNDPVPSISNNGIVWFQPSQLPSSSNWSDSVYGNSGYAVISGITTDSQTVSNSIDGITWTNHLLPQSARWQTVGYGGNTYVALGYDPLAFAFGNRGVYSNNGTTWSNVTGLANGFYSDIAYGNGTFVATMTQMDNIPVASNLAVTSPNGISWTTRTLARQDYWKTVAFGNNIFVAFGYGNNFMTSKDNGATWTNRTMSNISNIYTWTDMTHGNGVFFTAATGTNVAITSTDGINWTQRTLPITANWEDTAYGNGTMIIIDGLNFGGQPTDIAVTSTDNGVTWTRQFLPNKDYTTITFGG